MKIPKQVNIMGVTLKVLQKPQSFLTGKMGYAVDGFMDWEDKCIYLDEALSTEEKLLTFLHECGHAHHYACGYHLIINPEILELMCETNSRMINSIIGAKK